LERTWSKPEKQAFAFYLHPRIWLSDALGNDFLKTNVRIFAESLRFSKHCIGFARSVDAPAAFGLRLDIVYFSTTGD
jgi:hypothetical protein